jgi:hypothetical protein
MRHQACQISTEFPSAEAARQMKILTKAHATTNLATVVENHWKGQHFAHMTAQPLHELPSIMFLRVGKQFQNHEDKCRARNYELKN